MQGAFNHLTSGLGIAFAQALCMWIPKVHWAEAGTLHHSPPQMPSNSTKHVISPTHYPIMSQPHHIHATVQDDSAVAQRLRQARCCGSFRPTLPVPREKPRVHRIIVHGDWQRELVKAGKGERSAHHDDERCMHKPEARMDIISFRLVGSCRSIFQVFAQNKVLHGIQPCGNG